MGTDKVKKIQEEIMNKSHHLIEENLRIDNGMAWLTFEGLYELFNYLHSKRVRIEVNRELPKIPYEEYIGIGLKNTEMGKVVKRELVKANYVAVVPLIVVPLTKEELDGQD